MTLELDDDFESKLEEQLLDAAEEQLPAEGGPVAEAIERSHAKLRSVAGENDYDVDSVIETLEGPTVKRDGDQITIQWGWTHEAAQFFERGTVDHTIQGNPILSFIWEDAPDGVAQMFPESFPRVFFREVEVDGIEQSRFARHGLEWLRRELEGDGP